MPGIREVTSHPRTHGQSTPRRLLVPQGSKGIADELPGDTIGWISVEDSKEDFEGLLRLPASDENARQTDPAGQILGIDDRCATEGRLGAALLADLEKPSALPPVGRCVALGEDQDTVETATSGVGLTEIVLGQSQLVPSLRIVGGQLRRASVALLGQTSQIMRMVDLGQCPPGERICW